MSQKNLRLTEILSPAYFPAWRSETQNLVIGGSKGSGKSYFAAFYIIYNILKNPNLNVLVVRRVFGTMRDSCYTDLLKIINKYMIPEEWTHTFNPLEIKYNKTGQKILFRGLDDPYKMASITVENGYLAWVWFEEAFDITDYNDILKIQGSIRAIPPETGLKKKFIYTFNPWSPDHWLKEEYFDKERDDTLAMITTYLDNPGINDEDKEWYEQLKVINPRAAEVICYGHWGRAEGLIYDNWLELEFNPDEILQRPGTRAIYGLDFGYMTSYNAFMAAVLDTNKHELWVFDEIYSKGMTNLDIAKMITQAGYGKEKIIADSAEPKSIETLKTGRGLVEEIVDPDTGDVRYEKYSLPGIMPAFKGPDSVRNGIVRMQEFTIYIHPRCKNFKAEIQLYAYKVDKNGKLTGEPEKEYDHACLVGSTLITTKNGQVPIKDITVGTEVLTRNGWRKVTDWALTKKNAEIYLLKTEDGHILEGTGDHRIITAQGIKHMKDISSSDDVIIWADQAKQTIQTQNMLNTTESFGTDIPSQIVGQKEPISCTTMSGYIDMFGKNTMVQSQKDIKYITKMAIPEIMTYQTLNCLLPYNTDMNTPTLQRCMTGECNILPRIRINVRHGTDQKRGTSGIKHTLAIICGRRKNLHVSVVAKSLKHRITGAIGSALINVDPNGVETQDLIMKKESVKDVELNSQLTDIIKKDFVPVRVLAVKKLLKHEDVYNITVEREHEYFANGILVKNCDALRYAVTAAYATGHTKVAEAKGTPDIKTGTMFEIKEEKATPKKGHTRVVSTYSDPNEDWRSYYGGSYL